jgi:hypothetical protein
LTRAGLAATCAVAFAIATGGAVASRGDDSVRAAIRTFLPRAESAAAVANGGRGGPTAVQAQYNAARDLETALLIAPRISVGCRKAYEAALAYARGEITAAEGVDRLAPAQIDQGTRSAAGALGVLRTSRNTCTSSSSLSAAAWPDLTFPQSNAIVLGPVPVRVRAPAGADRGVVIVDGHHYGTVQPTGPTSRFTISPRPGRHSLAVRFFAGATPLGAARSRDVWVLPFSARYAVPRRAVDARLDADLARIGAGFPGYAAIWVHDLVTGRTAGWNEDARFPAASTVKLGVLLAGLRRLGPRPERSMGGYDLSAMARWSSNLASNRLLVTLGGSTAGGTRLAAEALRRAGATSSTFTGEYRVGTSAGHGAGAEDPPPQVSSRVTTARDLGRILYVMHAGALGVAEALRATGLTNHEAQVGLNLLLSSEARGDNMGLFRPVVRRGQIIAQKNGWLSNALHTAGILYESRGPKIVVVLTYRDGRLSRSEASQLARQVLRAAR